VITALKLISPWLTGKDYGQLIKNTQVANSIYVDDLDKDGILDSAETANGINSAFTSDDSDGDGVKDSEEIKNGTDPIIPAYNWYDKDFNLVPDLTPDTTSITGNIGNYSPKYQQLGYVQP